MKTIVLTVIFFALALSANVLNVFACRCSLPEKIKDETKFKETVIKHRNRAVAVFSGEITRQDEYKIVFKIDKIWKGETGEHYEMSTGTRLLGNGTYQLSSCDYFFYGGNKFLVFAYKTGHGDVQAYYCSLTQPLDQAARTEKALDELVKAEKLNPKPAKKIARLLFSQNILSHIL